MVRAVRVRLKANPEIQGWATQYNTHSLDEMIVYFEAGDATSDHVGLYEFQLRDGQWVNHSHPRIEADNYNTHFYEILDLRGIE